MPDTDVTLGRHEVEAARARVVGIIRLTPTLDVRVPTPHGEVPVTVKLEQLQVTGSFKPRGALNTMLQCDAPSFVACSGGNHGLAVAWAAATLGRTATIVVPASAAAVKVTAMRAYGAEVIRHGDTPSEAFEVAFELVERTGIPLIHPYDQPATVCGQGTLGLELAEQAPRVTHWLTAVGGGGLAAGVALALDGTSASVVPIEPAGCPGLFEAQRHGNPLRVGAEGIARTSLGAPSIGELPWSILRTRVVDCTLVSDEQIADAQRWLWQSCRIVAEPGGACAIAALLVGAWTPPPGAILGAIVCGGNADSLPV